MPPNCKDLNFISIIVIMPPLKEYSVVISRKKKIHGKYQCYDFDVISEYNPSAIFEYLNPPKSIEFSYSELRDVARKHLSAIGWKFWSKIKKGQDEWRYESPKLKKTYYSLNNACRAIVNGLESNTRDPFECNAIEVLGIEKSKRRSVHARIDEDRDIVSGLESTSRDPFECNVMEVVGIGKRKSKRIVHARKIDQKVDHRVLDGLVSDTRDPFECNAIEVVETENRKRKRSVHARIGQDVVDHRVLDGFNDEHCSERLKFRLISKKNGKFEHARIGQEVVVHKVVDGLNDENEKCSDGLKFRFTSKKRKVVGKVRSCSDGQISARVLRSRCSSVSQVPRTVLSWLIEQNVVVPRSKVFYFKENSHETLAEGRIGNDGIKCGCCDKRFSLSSFQAHVVGYDIRRPAENIFLKNGKSLMSCQVELMLKKIEGFPRESNEQTKETKSEICNDYVCSICQYGGDLILCDGCPSSFHANCLNLPVDVPEGDWFCPSCCCEVCGNSLGGDSLLCCHQCERQYHAHCKKDRDMAISGENWFCCKNCEKMHWGLQQLLGKPILVGQGSLTWTLIKPMQYEAEDHEYCDLVAMAENYSKLSVALEVMHECFEPVKDLRTKRDLVEDVLFCRGADLNRLNFKGFYTVLLERNDELIAVALLRIYGEKVAEVPLIGTRFQHRRLGMCRILMNEIEKTLLNLGVKKLVLPAAPGVLNTWTTSFGFSPISELDKSEFLGYTFLDFQGTFMCQKLLKKPPPPRMHLSSDIIIHHRPRRNIQGSSIIDQESNSSMSEDSQEDQSEESDTIDQGLQVYDTPSPMATPIISSNQETEQVCTTLKTVDDKKFERDKSYKNRKVYERENALDLRPPITPTNYVSCR